MVKFWIFELTKMYYFSKKKLAEDAADALYQVHGTYFDPINSADLCKYFIGFLMMSRI